MNYIKQLNLRPADRIVCPKSAFGMIQHHAIYMGEDFKGRDLIAENAFGKYVRIVTAEEFFTEYPEITRIIPFSGNELERKSAIKRALDQLGKPYSLINFNCENFANKVQFGKSFSNQISVAILLVVAITFINLLGD